MQYVTCSRPAWKCDLRQQADGPLSERPLYKGPVPTCPQRVALWPGEGGSGLQPAPSESSEHLVGWGFSSVIECLPSKARP